ncbi:MAG: DUF2569 domain-containing protein [Gammaproteobacteria bacterium]|jgi:hypothetical protein
MEKNIYEKPDSDLEDSEAIEVQTPEDDQDQKLKGLGGWLILVGFGVVAAPIRMLTQFVPVYMPIFSDGTFGALIDPDSDYYIPYFGAYIVGEIFCNAIILLASIYLIYLFFSKHHLFPRLYILIVAGSLFFILLDAWVGMYFFPGDPFMDEAMARDFGRVLIGALIWIPYMLVSKRVKLTFVEHRPK